MTSLGLSPGVVTLDELPPDATIIGTPGDRLRVYLDASKSPFTTVNIPRAGSVPIGVLLAKVGTHVVTVKSTTDAIVAGPVSYRVDAIPSPVPGPSDLQAALNACPAGGTVEAGSSTYTGSFSIPRRLILRGGDIIGKLTNGADDVTVEGTTIRDGTMSNIFGQGLLYSYGRQRLTLRDVKLFGGKGGPGGWIEGGSGHLLQRLDVHDNEPTGVHLHGVDSTVIDGGHYYRNNLAKRFNAGDEAGGLKIVQSTRVSCMGVEADHNEGPGIWYDVNSNDATIVSNRSHDNARQGIHFEISFRASIHHNVVWNCGSGFPNWGFGAGILISSASDADVFSNVVARCDDGIVVLSQKRGGAWDTVRNDHVHDNDVLAGLRTEYLSAFLQESFPGTLYTGGSMGNDGRYYGAGKFAWNGDKDLSGYNASPGEERGRYLTDAEAQAVLVGAGIP